MRVQVSADRDNVIEGAGDQVIEIREVWGGRGHAQV
jgi:hypothetical protein